MLRILRCTRQDSCPLEFPILETGYGLGESKKIQNKQSKWDNKGKCGILEERRLNSAWGRGQEGFHGHTWSHMRKPTVYLWTGEACDIKHR